MMEMPFAVQQPNVLPVIAAGSIATVSANLSEVQQFAPASIFAQNLMRITAAAEAIGEQAEITTPQGRSDFPAAADNPGNGSENHEKTECSGRDITSAVTIASDTSLAQQLAIFGITMVISPAHKVLEPVCLPGFTAGDTGLGQNGKAVSVIRSEEGGNPGAASENSGSTGRISAGGKLPVAAVIDPAAPGTRANEQSLKLHPAAGSFVLPADFPGSELHGKGELNRTGLEPASSRDKQSVSDTEIRSRELRGNIYSQVKGWLASNRDGRVSGVAIENATAAEQLTREVGVASPTVTSEVNRQVAERINPGPAGLFGEWDILLNEEEVAEVVHTSMFQDHLDERLPRTESEDGPEVASSLGALPGGKEKGKVLNGMDDVNEVKQPFPDAGKNIEVTNPTRLQTVSKPDTAGKELRDSILSQLNDSISSYQGKGNGQITVKLTPVELGDLKINVQVENRQVKVEITAGNHMVREVLMGNLDNLKETLLKQNLLMERFNVSTGVGNGFNHAFNEEKQPAMSWLHSQSVKGATLAINDEEVISSPYWKGREDALVDLRF